MLQFFDHQNARAFADNKPVALLVPGTRGSVRLVVARRKSSHGGEPAYAHRRHAGFAATANHHVGVAMLYQPERIANRVSAGGAGGRGRRIRPFGAIANGNVAARQIHNAGRNEKGRDAAGTALEQNLVLALDHLESADAAADINADVLRFLRLHLQAGALDRKLARRHRELNETPHLLYVFFIDVFEGVEILHFTRNAAGIAGSVELRDGLNAVLAVANRGPTFFRSSADRADEPYPCDNYSSRHVSLSVVPAPGPKANGSPKLLLLRLDVIDSVLHGLDLLRVFVRNIEIECFLKRHHQFDDVERIRAQIVDEGRAWVHLVLIHSELLDDDLLYSLCYRHSLFSCIRKRVCQIRQNHPIQHSKLHHQCRGNESAGSPGAV